MKRFKVSLALLAIVFAVASAFTVSKLDETVIKVQTSSGTFKNVLPANFNSSLCPTTQPTILCAITVVDDEEQPQTAIYGGYYQGQ